MLELSHVTISYRERPVVKDFSLNLEAGQICTLVGESGSGKTTVIRGVLGLLPSGGAVTGGEIRFQGQCLLENSPAEWRKLRGSQISMIFQDSGAMLNPTRKIGHGFVEYIRTHEACTKAAAWERGAQMLTRMGLADAQRIMNAYPFELSGGMRQRVGIAMAMTFQPKLLLADEPTSALDVTTQAQIVRQMMELRDEFGTSIVMVTHNLGVAAYMSDWIVVMKDGQVADAGDRAHILQGGSSYTDMLLDAVPTLGGTRYV